tara:strand:- start:2187 stop:2576 length:390 start_codon:yes stop_codon:yes gene_type:complete
MPYAELTFTAPLNVSCQVGDTAYYCSTSSGTSADGGFTNQSGNIVEIGEIREINNRTSNTPTMKVETSLGYSDLGSANGLSDKFILFNKNNKANLSTPSGYYAKVKLANNSTSEAELYSVAMETFTSSK